MTGYQAGDKAGGREVAYGGGFRAWATPYSLVSVPARMTVSRRRSRVSAADRPHLSSPSSRDKGSTNAMALFQAEPAETGGKTAFSTGILPYQSIRDLVRDREIDAVVGIDEDQ